MVLLLLAFSCASVDTDSVTEDPAAENVQVSEYAGKIAPDQPVEIPGTEHTVTLVSVKRSLVRHSSGGVTHSASGHAKIAVDRGDQSQTIVVDLGKQYTVLGLNLRVHGSSESYLVAGPGELSNKFARVP